jgi:hypothetical protein
MVQINNDLMEKDALLKMHLVIYYHTYVPISIQENLPK